MEVIVEAGQTKTKDGPLGYWPNKGSFAAFRATSIEAGQLEDSQSKVDI